MGSSERLRVLIRGAGAIACVLAARLAAHADVLVMTGWDEQAAALRAGVRFTDPGGALSIIPLRTIAAPEPADVVFLEVKSGGLAAACDELRTVFAGARAVVALQNGIGGQEIVAHRVDDWRFVPGVTYVAATRSGLGAVHQHSSGTTVLADGPANHAAAVLVADLLERVGLTVRRTEDWQRERWRKLVATAAVNGLCGILDRPLGDLTRSPAALGLADALAEEVVAVARAAGVDPGIGDVRPYLRERVRAGSANLPSILQDLRAGRETEVRYINGAVAEIGARAGVPAPCNAMLAALVEARSDLTRNKES